MGRKENNIDKLDLNLSTDFNLDLDLDENKDLVTLNCDAVESFAEPFSVNPQINGLNRREICAVMKRSEEHTS